MVSVGQENLLDFLSNSICGECSANRVVATVTVSTMTPTALQKKSRR
jgi:hypothetical protein